MKASYDARVREKLLGTLFNEMSKTTLLNLQTLFTSYCNQK